MPHGTTMVGLLGLVWTGLFVPWLAGAPHELADGEMERWCEIVVRDEEIQLRYSVGYNVATERQVREALAPYLPAMARGETGAGATSATGEQQRWLQALSAYITAHIQLQAEGQALAPKSCEVRPSGRHPMCWTVELIFPALDPATRECSLGFVDTAFPGFPGTARQALRSKSNWEVRNSPVASLIVRAKPVAWERAADEHSAPRPGAHWDALLTR